MRWGRIRLPAVWLRLLVMLLASATDAVPSWAGIGALLAGMALYARLGSPRAREPVPVAAPVVGRWRAVNSPANGVPSDGLQRVRPDLRDRSHPRADKGAPCLDMRAFPRVASMAIAPPFDWVAPLRGRSTRSSAGWWLATPAHSEAFAGAHGTTFWLTRKRLSGS